MKSEPEPEPEPVEAQYQEDMYKGDDSEDFNVKTEPDQGMHGMQGVQNGQQDHGDDYDRPIGIKEDGYV